MDEVPAAMTDLDLIAVWYLLRDDAERHRDDSAAVRYRAVTDEMRSRGFLATGEDDKSAVLAMIPSFRLRTHVQYFAAPLLAILAVLPFVMTVDLLRNAVVPVDLWFAGFLAFFCLLGMLAAWCAARVNFQGVTVDGDGEGVVIDNLFARHRLPWHTIRGIGLVGQPRTETSDPTKLAFLVQAQRRIVSTHPQDYEWPPSAKMVRHRAMLAATREAAAARFIMGPGAPQRPEPPPND